MSEDQFKKLLKEICEDMRQLTYFKLNSSELDDMIAKMRKKYDERYFKNQG